MMDFRLFKIMQIDHRAKVLLYGQEIITQGNHDENLYNFGWNGYPAWVSVVYSSGVVNLISFFL